jgi:6-phosphogluconolactonase
VRGVNGYQDATMNRRDAVADDGRLVVLPDLEQISHCAAEEFVRLANLHTPFCVALAGGGTPRRLYELLTMPSYRDRVSWSDVHLVWGDERCVPPDHPQSNYHMVERALLSQIDIPSRNIHRIAGELEPHRAASAYAAELSALLGPSGQLHLVLLGVGGDGHTASLFPGSSALQEQTRSVLATHVDKLDSWRVTLTLPAINQAHNVLFLVSGASKAPALARIFAGEPLPAGLINPLAGAVTWLTDQAAAQLLEQSRANPEAIT